jgi:Flp pilus assembly protein TadG
LVPGFRRLRHDEAGTTAIEFAVIAPVLILLVLAILQFGLALQIRSEMGQAAARAVRHVMLNPDANDTEFKAPVFKSLDSYDSRKLNVTAGQVTVGNTVFRTISVSYDLSISLPGSSLDLVTLTVFRRTPKLAV